ncbi:hypothetical protein [Nocardioides yefusunii]|uniref:Uncharacterized protein n=1 Tax=Nocardioides yefusunii TaxID=2500546 RepID=A0ABW1R496_9ACTN|nr:hypothetical protein [Nocardioides yefusunii]
MCRPTACKKCGKTTWAGCGMHVDDVKSAVPAEMWCDGHDDAAPADVKPAGKLTPGKGLLGWMRKNS